MCRGKHLDPWEEAIAAACHSPSSSSSHRIILCQHQLITSFSRFDLSTGFHSGSNSGHIHPSSPSSGLSFCLPPLTLCSALSSAPLPVSFFVCLDLPLSCSSSPPVSLPQDCCVYSLSRSPPVEDGDMPHHCGYRQLAVGITAATPLLRNWQRRTRKRERIQQSKIMQNITSFKHLCQSLRVFLFN